MRSNPFTVNSIPFRSFSFLWHSQTCRDDVGCSKRHSRRQVSTQLPSNNTGPGGLHGLRWPGHAFETAWRVVLPMKWMILRSQLV